MSSRALLLAPLLPALLLAGCVPDEVEPPVFELVVQGSRLVYDDEGGWFDLHTTGGDLLVAHGVASVMLGATDETGRRLATDGERERTVERTTGSDALGEADRLVVTVAGAAGEPDLVWTVSGYAAGGFYTFDVAVDNRSGDALALAKVSPLQIRREDRGGLYLGDDPARHRVLENGSYGMLDFVVEVVPGDVEQNEGYALLAPGDFAGHSVSSWNHAVADLDWTDGQPGSGAWVAGALEFDSSTTVINLSHRAGLALESPDGRAGFTYLSAEHALLHEPKVLAAGQLFEGEAVYVDPTAGDAGLGLERYADAVAAWRGLVPWHRREAGRRVPNGWNSWSGSSSTGGYGRSIDQEIILANLDVMTEELRDWGIDWFQIDDGYQPLYGDWWFDEELFPDGPAWIAAEIRARGFTPGLWMAPLTADVDSQLVAEHPEWFADLVPLGAVAVPSDWEVLDLSHPEVLQYLSELSTRLTQEWGFEWLKMDFGYYAVFGTNLHDPTLTREQAWRGAMEVMREALGEHTFWLIVGQLGTNYEFSDGFRLTQDNMPVWDHQPGLDVDDRLEQRGFKPTIRTAGRRWYLQDRVWVNHPDLILFRSNANHPEWPAVTLEETQAFCTFVALSGGIVKLGDKLVDLDGDAINTVRALIPIYGSSARPLDVFEREYPELWHLPVRAPLDGYDEDYELLGLFHWGANLDLAEQPYGELPDDGEDRAHRVALEPLGLQGEWVGYEFWTGQYLGRIEGELALDVPSHRARVVALRRPTGAPQFLGWNRQITMGGTVLGPVVWDEGARTLTLSTGVVQPTDKAPFVFELALLAPDGFALSDVASSGVDVSDLQTEVDGEVLRVSFVPEQTGDLELTLSF
jgi:hypothetical protein